MWSGTVTGGSCCCGLFVLNLSMASPTVGKLCDMSPTAMQVSLLRKTLSESLVTYVIWRVSRIFPDFEGPENRKIAHQGFGCHGC